MKRILPEEKMSWQRPVLSISNEGIATKGNRYIVGETPAGIFSGLTTDNIAWYDGIQWQEDIPEEGWVLYDANQTELLIYMNGPSGDYWYYFKDIFATGIGAGLVGTKQVDETNIADTKILEYDSTSDKLIYVAKPTGGGTGFFNKLDAITNPTVNDDLVDGYEVGSLWFNISTSKVFQCLNATTGAAVWVELTGSGGGGTTLFEFADISALLTNATAIEGDHAFITSTNRKFFKINNIWKEATILPTATGEGLAATADIWADFSDLSKLTIADGLISNIVDKGISGSTINQSTTTKRPTAIQGAKNGLSAAWFDGTDDFLAVTGYTAASPITVDAFLVYRPLVTGTSARYLFDVQTGRLVLANANGTNGAVCYYDGVWKYSTTANSLGWKLVEFHLVSGGTSTITVNGVLQTLSATTFANLAIGGAITIASNYDGSAGFFNGWIGEIRIYTSALSAGDITSERTNLNTKWSVY